MKNSSAWLIDFFFFPFPITAIFREAEAEFFDHLISNYFTSNQLFSSPSCDCDRDLYINQCSFIFEISNSCRPFSESNTREKSILLRMLSSLLQTELLAFLSHFVLPLCPSFLKVSSWGLSDPIS